MVVIWTIPRLATAWRQTLAVVESLGALLHLPALHAPSAAAVADDPIYAIGATRRPLAHAALHRALAVIAAAELTDQLLTTRFAEVQSPSAEATASAALHPGSVGARFDKSMRSGETLATLVPPPQPLRIGRGKARAWRNALHPATMLQAYCRLDLRQQRLTQRQARQTWLGEQLTAWEPAWHKFVAAALLLTNSEMKSAEAEAEPSSTHQRELLALRQLVRERLAAVDEWLETLSATATGAGNRVEHLCHELETYCASLPTWSLHGIWMTLTTPHRWLPWLWQCSVGLPLRLQRLQRAIQIREMALYDEANGHVIRQFGLAVLHDVQSHIATLQGVRRQLAAIATYLEQERAIALAALPWPWDKERLAALAAGMQQQAHLLDEREPILLTELFDAHGGFSRHEHERDAASQSDSAHTAELCIAWAGREYQSIVNWNTTAWLQATFALPASMQKTAAADGYSLSEIAAAAWLLALHKEAQPTWLQTATDADQPTECWLALPTVAPAGDSEPSPTEQWLQKQAADVHILHTELSDIWLVQRVRIG